MGNYNLPKSSPLLIALGTKNSAGMHQYATSLGITLITPAEADANLAAFIAQDGLYNAARSEEQLASDTYQATLEPIYQWLLGVSNMLSTRFGTRWNTLWAQAGFTNHTTAIPTRIEDQLSLAVALVTFFTANPSYEVPTMNQTAAYGKALRDASVNAQKLWVAAKVKTNGQSTAWNNAYTTLTDGMRALLRNLSSLLDNDDPRWLAFGFNMPATPTTPGKPVDVTVQLDENGSVMVLLPAVPLATRYRFRRRIVGVETSFSLAFSSKEPVGWISDVLSGQTVEIIVQAVNGSLQGVASDPVVFSIPPVTKKLEANGPAPDLAKREAATPSVNGHRSGRRQTTVS